tara:strand:+ start:106 stop:291 length:186 start_codon:yes stop_codon:yes gene_type:complete
MSNPFSQPNDITEDELTEAIRILCNFVNDHHEKDVSKNVRNAVIYLEKAMADDELVMVYYP